VGQAVENAGRDEKLMSGDSRCPVLSMRVISAAAGVEGPLRKRLRYLEQGESETLTFVYCIFCRFLYRRWVMVFAVLILAISSRKFESHGEVGIGLVKSCLCIPHRTRHLAPRTCHAKQNEKRARMEVEVRIGHCRGIDPF
jgi:predicted secreted protein